MDKGLAHIDVLYKLGCQPFCGEILVNGLRDKPIGISCIFIFIAKPAYDLMSILVDTLHKLYLGTALVQVILVDANRVDP